MEILLDLAFGLLMLFIAYMAADFAKTWWHKRNGYDWDASVNRWCVFDSIGKPERYVFHKTWTWFVWLLAWGVALWNVSLAVAWFMDFAFAVTT